MRSNLKAFYVDSPRFEELPSYADVAVLKSYLEGKREDDEASHEAAFVCDVVELMTELRYEAEDNFRNCRTQAINKRGELCLKGESLTDRLTNNKDDEPPKQLVSVIASRHLPLIETLIHSMRKTLRRKRDMVSISEVQQVDAHCLRWLARQPGHTASEKAGTRQKLMAVVREETRNTLENRVLKDFIIRVAVLARCYLQQYESIYSKSQQIIEVRRLRNCLNFALKLPEIQNLPAMKSLVQPNYVLLHDSKYSKLWELYRLVLAHTRMAEIVWPKRHQLFAEIFCIWAVARLSLEYKSYFDISYWIKEMPTHGCFLVNPVFTNAFAAPNGDVLSCVVSSSLAKLEIKSTKCKKRIRLLYIPYETMDEIFLPDDDVIYVVCCFSDKNLLRPLKNSNIVRVTSLLQIDAVVSEILKGV